MENNNDENVQQNMNNRDIMRERVEKELQNESRKHFSMGLFSGILISVFIGSIVLCGKVLIDNYKVKGQEQEVKDSISEASKHKDTVLADEKTIDKMLLIEDIIDEYFIEDVDKEDIKDGIYSGMMQSLEDPYAVYYDAEALKKLNEDTQGVYFGIGAYLQKDPETLYPRITSVIENTPAEESGILADDYIIKVGDMDVFDMDLSEVVSYIKGPAGTTVHLTLLRKSSNDTIELDVERRKVETPTVKYEIYDDGLAYISISEFDTITVDQFVEAIANVRGAKSKGLILDLRGNPGGSLTSVVEIANYLLPKGNVVYTEDKYGKKQEYKCDGKNEIDIPMIVLVDGGSASASEILAGAIKDYKKGQLLGTTTFGKGIVQRVLSLPDGTAVKLTVSHYYTPLGNDINKVGIEPDIVLEFDSEAYLENKENDNQLNKAKELLREQIK